ncbi:unnamed protein product, partial [Didymodactylos carnosus]
SINYRLGRGFGNYNRGGMGRFNVNQRLTGTSGVLQRVTLGRGRRMGGNLFSSRGGNRNPRRAGLTIGRERTGLRTFRGRFSRGFNNNNNLQSNQNNSKRNGFQSGRGRGASIRSFRGNRGNGNNSRGNSNRGVGNFRGRGRGAKNNENQSKNNNKNNDNNTSVTKEKLDSDLDRYMSQTKIDNSFDILNSNDFFDVQIPSSQHRSFSTESKYEIDPNGYVLFCPCMAAQFLGSLIFMRILNRTLVLPHWMKYPSAGESLQIPFDRYFQVEHAIISYKTSLFICGCDDDHMIEQFEKILEKKYDLKIVKYNGNENVNEGAHINLYILGVVANNTIVNCPSTFPAFVKRMRDVNGKQTAFGL